MIKDTYFSIQFALLFLAVCGAFDMWCREALPGVYAVIIILACIMSFFSSAVFFKRLMKKGPDIE